MNLIGLGAYTPPTEAEMYGSNSADYFKDGGKTSGGGWADIASKLLTAGSDFVQALKSPNMSTTGGPGTQPVPQGMKATTVLVIAGLAAAAIGGGIYLATRKKKSK